MVKQSRNFRINWTRHVRQRAVERGIELEQIYEVLLNPIETIFDREQRNYKSYGMPSTPLIKEQPYLMVVHSKFNTVVTVITAMWKDKGGLRQHDFSKI